MTEEVDSKDEDMRPKLEIKVVSQYFDRSYLPTKAEIDEMAAIRKDLKIEEPSRDAISGHVMDGDIDDDTTKAAIKSIFFPTASDQKSIFLTSGNVELYEKSGTRESVQDYELKLFSNGFMFCTHPPSQPDDEGGQPRQNIFKRLGNAFSKESELASKSRVNRAFLLSNIHRVESLDVWKDNDIKIYLGGDKQLVISQKAFAIFIQGIRSPILVRCNSCEEVKSWINAFRTCVSGQKSKVIGKKRTTVKQDGVVFGINNTGRSRSSEYSRDFLGSVQWCDDNEDW